MCICEAMEALAPYESEQGQLDPARIMKKPNSFPPYRQAVESLMRGPEPAMRPGSVVPYDTRVAIFADGKFSPNSFLFRDEDRAGTRHVPHPTRSAHVAVVSDPELICMFTRGRLLTRNDAIAIIEARILIANNIVVVSDPTRDRRLHLSFTSLAPLERGDMRFSYRERLAELSRAHQVL